MNVIDIIATMQGGGVWPIKDGGKLNHVKNTDSEASKGYLFNDCDVYVKIEPCFMCSMALVHSRVRRVFFNEFSSKGALQSLGKLHTIKELNHDFEVYRIYRPDKYSR